jgi:tRNA nucleotidyltransferase (CCA-adding enzyme)
VFGVASRLRFSKHEGQWLATIVERWQALDATIAKSLGAGDAAPASVRRWIATIGRPQLAAFFRVAAARWAARRDTPSKHDSPAPAARAVHSVYRRTLRAALTEPVDLRDLAIDGDDLRQAGIAPGPKLGKILSLLLDLVIEDPTLNTFERLLQEARRLDSELK